MPRNKHKRTMQTDRGTPTSVLGADTDQKKVSVSLAYYRPETECFSAWSSVDLKNFVSAMKKMRSMTAHQLMHSQLSTVHLRKPAENRFVRPSAIGEDHRMHEIRVDRSNTARMHGIIEGSVFYLVWLDRKHAVFPSRN